MSTVNYDSRNKFGEDLFLRIFHKENGNSFGLHTSALAMSEIKGKLIAESDGEGKGAKFIVSIPIK